MLRDPKDRLPADRLILALDVDSVDRATRLVDALAGQVTRFKIGSQLFTAAGPSAVEAVRKRGGDVFLDRIEQRLKKSGHKVKRYRKARFSIVAPEGLKQEIRANCDVVVEALAD